MINRWMKRLDGLRAKSPEVIHELESLIDEMNITATEYTIKPEKKANLLLLLKQSEDVLSQYDDVYPARNSASNFRTYLPFWLYLDV
jgi:hypothetical protein